MQEHRTSQEPPTVRLERLSWTYLVRFGFWAGAGFTLFGIVLTIIGVIVSLVFGIGLLAALSGGPGAGL
ncbi:MAG: hypothetical protein ACR2MC_03850 [Actinomycetota bacterium]